MQNSNDPLESLLYIKNMMMKSSKINTLSGKSSICAGTFATLGALASYFYLQSNGYTYQDLITKNAFGTPTHIVRFLVVVTLIILILSVLSGILFTYKKSQELGQDFFSASMKNFAQSIAVPLFLGGMFCIAMIWYGVLYFVLPMSLLVYGYTLYNAGKYTYDEITTMGIIFMLLGVVSSFHYTAGLWYWVLGFGCMHIVFGFIINKKYNT